MGSGRDTNTGNDLKNEQKKGKKCYQKFHEKRKSREGDEIKVKNSKKGILSEKKRKQTKE